VSTAGTNRVAEIDTEVSYENPVIFHKEHILALEVSMDHMILMYDFQCQNNLEHTTENTQR
jgi:hypothetical protein